MTVILIVFLYAITAHTSLFLSVTTPQSHFRARIKSREKKNLEKRSNDQQRDLGERSQQRDKKIGKDLDTNLSRCCIAGGN